jgi:uncharacterized protein YciI
MSTRFAYVYLMADDPQRIRSIAPQHTAHWQGLDLQDYRGGPFADKTGGLITFAVGEAAEAEAAVAADPFVRERLLERSWLKRWDPIEPDGSDHPGSVDQAQERIER